MRFSWVPTTTDAIFPFVVGIIEFALISAMGPGSAGAWFVIMGILFIAMPWVTQVTMKRAREDPDNATFFAHVRPALLQDHLRSAVAPAVLVLMGIGFWVTGYEGTIVLLATAIVFVMLCWQFWMNHVYTRRAYEREDRAPQDGPAP